MICKINVLVMFDCYYSFFITMPWRARILASVNCIAPWMSLKGIVFTWVGLHTQK